MCTYSCRFVAIYVHIIETQNNGYENKKTMNINLKWFSHGKSQLDKFNLCIDGERVRECTLGHTCTGLLKKTY